MTASYWMLKQARKALDDTVEQLKREMDSTYLSRKTARTLEEAATELTVIKDMNIPSILERLEKL